MERLWLDQLFENIYLSVCGLRGQLFLILANSDQYQKYTTRFSRRQRLSCTRTRCLLPPPPCANVVPLVGGVMLRKRFLHVSCFLYTFLLPVNHDAPHLLCVCVFFPSQIMDHLESNRDMFEPYMEDDEPFGAYLRRMRGDAEWGGNQELVAASQLYKVHCGKTILKQSRSKWTCVM